jgi:hypothetical protein
LIAEDFHGPLNKGLPASGNAEESKEICRQKCRARPFRSSNIPV